MPRHGSTTPLPPLPPWFHHGSIEFHRQEHHLEDSCVCLPHPVLNLPPIRSAAGGDVHSLALDETGAMLGMGMEMGIRKGRIETHTENPPWFWT